jgi:DNA-binding transcriptional LysR family regulator
MDMVALRTLVSVVQAGSFAEAARRLGLTATTLGRRVAVLEDELGLTLLERRRKGLRLTSGGAAVIAEVRRILTDLDGLASTAHRTGLGEVGKLRLGVRLPPIGDPLRLLLDGWRQAHPDVVLSVYEMSDHALHSAIETRMVDVALFVGLNTSQKISTESLYREELVAALPAGHSLCEREILTWRDLRSHTILVQDWPDSHVTRELYSNFIGIGSRLVPHCAGKQSLLALVAASFGITLAVKSQTQSHFPGVVFRPICEPNAWVDVNLAWAAEAEDAVVGRFVASLRDGARLHANQSAARAP